MKKLSLLALVLTVSTALSANADTLETALAKAYEYNPALKAARAATGAVDENVAIAKSGYRPTLTVEGGYSDSKINTNSTVNGVAQRPVDGYERTLTAKVSQPIFSGFKTVKFRQFCQKFRKSSAGQSFGNRAGYFAQCGNRVSERNAR